MINPPLVSVLMTSYNREKYIAVAIDSVLASSYNNFELIIVDDGSSDSTVKIAREYEKTDRRIKVYANPVNLGQFQNRNKAASFATGKYLKYVDSDDMITSNTLSIMVEGMERFGTAGIGVVYGDKSKIDLGGGSFKLVHSRAAYLWHYYNGGMLFPGPSGCIFKTEHFIKQNGFPLGLGINGDIYLNLKIAAVSDVVLFPIDLIFWRKHEEQVDELQQDYYAMHKERFIINREILKGSPLPINAVELKRIRLSNKILFIRGAFINYFLKGNFKKFRSLLQAANVGLGSLPIIILPLRFLNSFKKQIE